MMNWISDLRGDLDHAERLETDLTYFAEQYLRIRPKAGSLVPFVFNAAQLELHRRLEEQKAKTGKVRAIVLKARQMGISTYIAARYYKQTVGNKGLRTIIIGHEKRANTGGNCEEVDLGFCRALYPCNRDPGKGRQLHHELPAHLQRRFDLSNALLLRRGLLVLTFWPRQFDGAFFFQADEAGGFSLWSAGAVRAPAFPWRAA